MTQRPRHPRTSCIVPFCRRTSTLFRYEWVCGEHWRLVDRCLKRLRTKLLKRLGAVYDRAEASRVAFQVNALSEGREVDDGVWQLVDTECRADRRYRAVEATIWRRMKRQAIERASGVGG